LFALLCLLDCVHTRQRCAPVVTPQSGTPMAVCTSTALSDEAGPVTLLWRLAMNCYVSHCCPLIMSREWRREAWDSKEGSEGEETYSHFEDSRRQAGYTAIPRPVTLHTKWSRCHSNSYWRDRGRSNPPKVQLWTRSDCSKGAQGPLTTLLWWLKASNLFRTAIVTTF